jgi:SAM-dependent methyltransferase
VEPRHRFRKGATGVLLRCRGAVAQPKPEIAAAFDPERYWSHRLEEKYSLAGVGWLGLSEPFNRWMYAVRRRVFRRALRGSFDHSQARVLDVGSGTGFYVALWQELGVRDVIGCDLTQVAVERLLDRFPGIRFEQVDISSTRAEFKGSYDAISAMDVLFHIVDDAGYRRALRNLSELLAPDGLLIFTEDLPHGETIRHRHQASRSFEEVHAILCEVGLKIELRRPLFVLMNNPVDSHSVLLARMWSGVRVLARNKTAGWLLGALLFPLELTLTRFVREGPATEIVICRRRVAGTG